MGKYKILIVDDELEYSQVMSLQLSMRGYSVITARDGLEGFATAVKERPDLILADVIMPNIDGYEFCTQIKAHPELKHIPVIFVTARTDQASRAKGYAVGGARFITKPFDEEELYRAIDLRLKDRDKIRKLYANKAEKFSGDLKVVNIFSLLDMFSLNSWSGQITINHPSGQGVLEIGAGEVLRCTIDGRQEMDSLMTVLSWDQGKFTAERL